MVKNAFRTDVLREIKKSSGRFLGVFAIVLLGVSIFAGLGATGSVMRELGDRYFREYNFMDIRLLCSYGLSEKDIAAVRETEGVALVQPAYSLDALTTARDSELVLKLHSLPKDSPDALNRPRIISGRYPERTGEALVEPGLLRSLGLEIGDSFRLASGKSSDIRVSLRTHYYRIVGVARSPLYYANLRGTSSIGSGDVDFYMMIPESDFRMGVYTEAYIRAEGTSGLFTYADEYDTILDELSERLEALGDIRTVERKGELTRSAFEALETAERELSARRRSAYEGLDSAAKTLLDSRVDISRGRLELAGAELDVEDSRAEIERNRYVLSSAIIALDQGLEEIAASERTLREATGGFQYSEGQLLSAEGEIVALKGELTLNIERLDEGKAALLDGLDSAYAALEPLEAALLLAPGDPLITAQLDYVKSQISYLEAQLDELEELYESAASGMNQLLRGEIEIAESRQLLESGRFSAEQNLSTVLEARAVLENQRLALWSGLGELDSAYLQYIDGLSQLEQNRLSLSGGERAVREGETELDRSIDETVRGLDAAETAISAQRAALYELADPVWYVLDRSANESFASYESDAEKIHIIGRLIPMLFFLVAALVSLTTMSRMVEEQRTDMGALKALGYGGFKILSRYLLYAFVPTFFGSLAGGYIGQLLFPSVIINAYQGIYPLSPYGYSFHYFYWFGGLLLAVCSTLFTTIYVCVSELRAVPAVLMRRRAPQVGKKTPLEYITPVWRRLSFLYKITFRNAFRYKKRFYMTIFGVAGCTALLVTGFGLQESVSGLVARQYGDIHHYGMAVSFDEDISSGELKSLRSILEGDAVVRDIALSREKRIDVSFGGKSESVTMIVPEYLEGLGNYITLRERIGHRELIPGDGVIITEKLSTRLGVSAGDEISLSDSSDEKYTVTVAGICETYFMHSIYMSPELYSGVFGEDVKLNTIYALTADQAELDSLTAELLEHRTVGSVALTSRLITRFTDSMGSLGAVISVIIVLAAALAFIVLLNLTSINIAERTREIATIQVLGFRDNEVAAYIYRENRVVALMGTLLGLFFGKYFQQFVMISAEPDFVMFSRELGAINFIISGAMTMTFVVCVDLITTGRLRRINMVEALKSNE